MAHGSESNTRGRFALSFGLALAVHACVMFSLRCPSYGARNRPSIVSVYIDLEPPPHASPPEEPPPPPPTAQPAAVLPNRAASVPRRSAAPKPAPATEAPASPASPAPSLPEDLLLASTPATAEPVDLTASSAPIYGGGSGRGGRGAGGTAEGKLAVLAQARSGSSASPDLSRAASLSGGLDWHCAFPREADVGEIDAGLATLSIVLDAAGRMSEVAVLGDSGHGFGEAARACAQAKRYVPALDSAGNPTASRMVVHLRFVR